jgi:hypothetical protein
MDMTNDWGFPAQSKKFFDLPTDVKAQIEHQPGPRPQRGWSHVGSESTAKLFGALQNKKVQGKTDGKVSSCMRRSREATYTDATIGTL